MDVSNAVKMGIGQMNMQRAVTRRIDNVVESGLNFDKITETSVLKNR